MEFTENLPISYPVLRAILPYLSIKTRRELAIAAPDTRNLHENFGFHFDKVHVSSEHLQKNVQFDSLKWESDIIRSVDLLKIKSEQAIFLAKLKETVIGTFEIETRRIGSEMFENLKNLNVKNIKIRTEQTDQDLFDLRPKRKLEIFEYFSNQHTFQKYCEHFKGSSDSAIGSSYSTVFNTPTFDPEQFIDQLKTDFHGTDKYLDGRKCATVQSRHSNSEVNIYYERKDDQANAFVFTVLVSKKGSSFTPKMTALVETGKRVLRGMSGFLLPLILFSFMFSLTLN
ncbi:unnamed protein product [Caenorhabditis sp. 36 PRJEB53466]|nr:unnamed protein product [Caenorhabditis sp. 36 PRJEB53466]